MDPSAWFLTTEERGNDATQLDRRHRDGKAWTDGNDVRVLIEGATYFRRLYDTLCGLRAEDWVHFTDWRGDADERLAGPGSEVARVLAEIARRGVDVRGLVWRSHPDQTKFSEQENLHVVETINEAGGEVFLDERVRRGGSHHQKLFVVRRQDDEDIAFVGGIDLCHGRHDDATHHGDEQAIKLDPRFGPRPPWHDVQLEVHGPAVGDLAWCFRERWEDPTPVDHRNPLRSATARISREQRRPGPLPAAPDDPQPSGNHSVQVLRTYPAKRPPYPFAPAGERSIARAYIKAFRRARRLIYVEDQYLWLTEAASALADALRRSRDLHVIALVPRYPDRDGRFSGPPNRIGQQRAISNLVEAGGDRVAVFDLEAPHGVPIYVHAKVCIIDDTWLIVGSDNLNRRSWTHDSELTCAVVDEQLDARDPADPGGHGDGARVLARDTRLRLWREHLERGDGDNATDDLIDPTRGFAVLRAAADALDDWHAAGRVGPRPASRLRNHDPGRVQWWAEWWAEPAYRVIVDPDGRPWRARRRGEL
ncbi:MAG: phospholipase [Actinomycetia bacterium]|nr:phospholipase [Actinomycetes bacterium]